MPKILTFLSFFVPVLFIGVGLAFAGSAMHFLLANAQTLECFCPSCQDTAFAHKGVASLGLIKVDIQGAVKSPGIYQLEVGQRTADLVASAGGFLKTADQVFVAKSLNLATELQNQDKVYVPFAGENAALNSQGAGQSPSASSSSLISINQADAATLQTLSGIGEAKSKAIIEGRPYGSLQDLVDKKILSENLLAELKSQLSL